MIDIGEIADLVLLMLVGSFSLEMVCTIYPLQNLFLQNNTAVTQFLASAFSAVRKI